MQKRRQVMCPSPPRWRVGKRSPTLAARRGILVRERLALESARDIDVVLFDKTGTLTLGQQGVTDIFSVSGAAAESPKTEAEKEKATQELLRLAASLEANSEHIIGRAIVSKAREQKVDLLPVQDFNAVTGQGVVGKINGQAVIVGNLALGKAKVPAALEDQVVRAGKEGKTIVFVVRDGTVLGALGLADVIREESRAAVNALQKMQVRVAMLTGDSKDVATWVARELNIKEFFAEVKPAQKAAMVKKLQGDGSRVAMVGDGVNDAPALAQADIGIAIGAGTDVAIESAGIILIKNDPRDIVKIMRLSRATYRKMQQNLVWATGYNIIAIPLAAGVLASLGILLPPALGALFMSASTVIVALNAQVLRTMRL